MLDATTAWTPASKEITVFKPGYKLQLTLNSDQAIVNGKAVKLPVAIKSKNGTAIIPVRFLAENLGYEVTWQQEKVNIRP